MQAVQLGRLWFQLRSFSPVPFFVAMWLLPPDFRWEGAAFLIPLAVALAAEGLRIWSVGYAGSATRTRGDGVPRLIHAGPYRYVRNPLYVANVALYTACSVLYGFVGLSVVLALYSIIQYGFIVAFEEDTLSRLFGASYDDYRSKVPRWLPALEPAIESTGQQFDLAKAIRSERTTLTLIALMAVGYAVKASL